MTGTPDNIMSDHIFDNKASWSVKTFPFFDTELKKQRLLLAGSGVYASNWQEATHCLLLFDEYT